MHVHDGRVSAERSTSASGDGAIVVGRGGWRLPEDLLRSAGIETRARAELRGSSVVVEPAEGARVEPTQSPPEPRSEAVPKGDSVETTQDLAAPIVAAVGVTKRFGAATPIEALDAAFGAGSLSVVTGPSGSGKTTLLHLLAGLELPDEGDVLVDGISLSSLDRTGRAELRRTRLAFVGQTLGLVPFLGLRARERRAGARAARARNGGVEEALAALGLAEHAERPVSELSAGQRARALSLAPSPSARA